MEYQRVVISEKIIEDFECGLREGDNYIIKEALEKWLNTKLELLDVEEIANKYGDKVIWDLEWISKYQKGWKRKVVKWDTKEILSDIMYLNSRLNLNIDLEEAETIYENVEYTSEAVLEEGKYYEIKRDGDYIIVYVEFETEIDYGWHIEKCGWETYYLVFKIVG